MIIGQKDQLAFEFKVVRSNDALILGHFRMWANNQEIGNFEDVQIMGVIQAQMERALKLGNQRIDTQLFAANKDVAFGTIHKAIYGADGPIATVAALSTKYSCFDLTNLGAESFDGLFVFLICSASGQRLLWRRSDALETVEARFAADTFETTAREYLSVFAQIHGTHT